MKERTIKPRLRTVIAALALALGSVSWQHGPGGQQAPRPTAVTLARVPHNGIQPELAQDDQGRLHMIYFAGTAGAGDLFYVRSMDGGASFSPPVRVNRQPGSVVATGTIRGGQMALGRGGRVHVAWIGSKTAIPQGPVHPRLGRPTPPVLYARSNEAGTAFEPQASLPQRSYGIDGDAIAADDRGNVYVAWHGLSLDDPGGGEEARRVWLARSSDDGGTFGPEVPAWDRPTGACACCGLRLFAAPGGPLYALYRSATDRVHRDMVLLQSADQGQTFHGARVHEWDLAACPMSSMAMTAAAGMRVFAAWETAGQVYTGVVDSALRGAGPDIAAPVGAPDSTGNRKHPRIVANRRGEVLLVWAEGTGWMRGGAVAWQHFDADLHPVGAPGRVAGLPVWSFASPAARPDGTFVIFY